MAEEEETQNSGDNSGWGILFSLLVLVIYFMFMKPTLTIGMIEDNTLFMKYVRQKYIMMAILLCIMVALNLIINAIGFSNKCGGGAAENFGKVFMPTFIPWLLIFGAVLVILVVFPGFKGAFSNVIGYYAVARSANHVLVELLGNPEIDRQIEDASGEESDPESKRAMKAASDAILKLVGNTSILINQITPTNFMGMWDMMTPLFKKEYRFPSGHMELKKELLELVRFKDNVGEFCWYLYTAVLLVILVKTRLMEVECVSSLSAYKERAFKYKIR